MTGLAADLVVMMHFLFVLFVVLGGLLTLKWQWCAFVHLPAAIWGMLLEFLGWQCPLTPLEKWLRASADQEVYGGGFIHHYLYSLLYPDELTRQTQLALGISVLVINIMVYGYVLYRFRH